MYDVVYNTETGEEECSGERDRAKARVHMIMDQREKAHQLTNALIRKRESHAQPLPKSPEVCKMLDKFT